MGEQNNTKNRRRNDEEKTNLSWFEMKIRKKEQLTIPSNLMKFYYSSTLK